MHIHNNIGVGEDYDTEGFHNIIANIPQVFLVYSPVIPPHAFFQLEPNTPLEVDASINYKAIMTIISNTFFLRPIPEIVHGSPFQLSEAPFISCKILH